MSGENYSSPVSRLLALGNQSQDADEWACYATLGIGEEHIPDLIRMATDDALNRAGSKSHEVWAPLHAWRALGQLRAEAAIQPLMHLFDGREDDDWAMEELPEVYRMIGPAAIPALAAFLEEDGHTFCGHSLVVSALEKIGQAHPEARESCISAMSRKLECFEANDPDLNGFIISSLVELKSMGSLPLIERAFAAGRVDELWMDPEDVQVGLGLRAARETRPMRQVLSSEDPGPSGGEGMLKERSSSKELKARKAKRKQAKASRRINRKRK